MDGATDIKVRPAQHEDFERVMDINRNVYNGEDYMDSNYHDFIRRYDGYCFVGEINGNVICFLCYIMDGDAEMVKVGVRMHPEYQGRGCMSDFQKITEKIMLQKFPTLCSTTWTAKVNPFYNNKDEMTKRSFQLLETFHCDWWRMRQPDVARFYQDHLHLLDSHPAIPLNNDRAAELLSLQENLEALFPTGYILGYYNWQPRKTNPRNIRKLIQTHRVVVTMATRTKISAVSFVAPNQLPCGNIFGINFYQNGESADTFLTHVVSHAGFAARTTAESSVILIHCRPQINVDIERVKRVIEPYGFLNTTDERGTGVMLRKLFNK